MSKLKCWKYKLLKPFCKPNHFPMCCAGCKWGSNMSCSKESVKERLRKRILMWLLGTDNVEKYIELLDRAMSLSNEKISFNNEKIGLVKDHLNTLEREKDTLDTMRKMIKVCDKLGINIGKEIKEVQ